VISIALDTGFRGKSVSAPLFFVVDCVGVQPRLLRMKMPTGADGVEQWSNVFEGDEQNPGRNSNQQILVQI